MLVALGVAIFADERLSSLSLCGVILTSLGIASIAFLHDSSLKEDPKTLLFAAGTGIIIASYTVADDVGVRLSNSPFSFIAWLFFFEFPVVLFVFYRRRKRLLVFCRSEFKQFVGAGLGSVLAYGLVIYAVAFAPMAAISALRETSVTMATLIGTFVLGERPWQQRVTAAVIVACGVTLITGSG